MPRKKRDARHLYSMLTSGATAIISMVLPCPSGRRPAEEGTLAADHGAAAKRGRNMIENYIMWCGQDAKPLPEPALFDTHFYSDDEDEAQERDAEAAAHSTGA